MTKKSILGAFSVDNVLSKTIDHHIVNVPFMKIKPAKDNRNIGDIIDLAEDIAENGLNSNLLVRKIDEPDYEYELVAGHRRYAAIRYNLDRGYKDLEFIPCKIQTQSDDDAYVSLVMDNALVKPLTQAELLHAIERLKEIFKRRKEAGEAIPGRINHLISEVVGLGKSQVANYEKVLNHAIPEVMEEIEKGTMTINAAAELASMEEEDQLTFIEEKEGFDIKSVKEYKEQLFSEGVSDDCDPDETYWEMIDHHIYTDSSDDDHETLECLSSAEKVENDSLDNEYMMTSLQNELVKKFDTQVSIKNHKLSFYFSDTDDLNRILEIMNSLVE